MKPLLLKISSEDSNLFNVRRDLTPTVNSIWHYHQELELIYFKKGKGTQYIGDKISTFKSGDIVLVGANLPHYWRFDKEYFEEGTETADVYVIHFTGNFLSDKFLNANECTNYKRLITNSHRGLEIKTDKNIDIIKLIEKTESSIGSNRLLNFLEALFLIADNVNQLQPITSMGFEYQFIHEELDQLQAVYNYTFNNFKKQISLAEIASVANVSPNTFCRFFKARSKKNYTNFINEIRIAHACKLLMENKLRINEVCYESGFNNFTSFHKCFKTLKGMSPLQYQKTFIQK